MLMVMPQIITISIIIVVVLYFLFWRTFSKVGNAVNKEVTKIKKEAIKEEKKDE